MLALVETDEADDAAHVVRIAVARRGLMDEAGFFDASLGGDGEHDGCDMVYGRDVQYELLVRRYLRLSFEGDEDQRGGRRKALVPAGERIADRGFDDARADDGAHHVRLRCDKLLAKA